MTINVSQLFLLKKNLWSSNFIRCFEKIIAMIILNNEYYLQKYVDTFKIHNKLKVNKFEVILKNGIKKLILKIS